MKAETAEEVVDGQRKHRGSEFPPAGRKGGKMSDERGSPDRAGPSREKTAQTGQETECGTCTREDCSARKARADEGPVEFEERQALKRRLCRIRHKLLVLSGKGGVGKSTVAVNLAVSLSLSGRRVGLLDIDIHGPSVPRMMGLNGRQVRSTGDALLPVELNGLRVMSLGFLLPREEDAVIWRGPLKMGLIKQFLKDVEWGELDYLVVDAPPGTGDEPLSVCQLIDDADGAVIVATPQEVALSAVRKSVTFCRQLRLPVLGIVENMSGFVCPHCGRSTEIFKTGGGERLARECGVPFLGRIPIDPAVGEACDGGTPFVGRSRSSETAKAFEKMVARLLGGFRS